MRSNLKLVINNPIFIYMKPTIINILFALALFFGKYFTNEPIEGEGHARRKI